MSEIAAYVQSLAWNDNNYKQPTGERRQGTSYAVKSGYGHEEWNNNPKWQWKGFRVFHSEGSGNIEKHAVNGNCVVVFISRKGQDQYLLGAACEVYQNTREEMEILSKHLETYKNIDMLWKLDTVKEIFNTKNMFEDHWKEQHKWIKWRCPSDLFIWLDEPELIDVTSITGKQLFSTHYKKPQSISKSQLVNIVGGRIPNEHDIIRWINEKKFEKEDMEAKNTTGNRDAIRSNRPTDQSYIRYVRNIELTIWPKHDILQSKFIKFLKEKKCHNIRENIKFIDVTFKNKEKHFIAEIKPGTGADVKYAIRSATGQILEYNHFIERQATPMIVLEDSPTKEQIAFVLSLGIELCWYDVDKFQSTWSF